MLLKDLFFSVKNKPCWFGSLLLSWTTLAPLRSLVVCLRAPEMLFIHSPSIRLPSLSPLPPLLLPFFLSCFVSFSLSLSLCVCAPVFKCVFFVAYVFFIVVKAVECDLLSVCVLKSCNGAGCSANLIQALAQSVSCLKDLRFPDAYQSKALWQHFNYLPSKHWPCHRCVTADDKSSHYQFNS